METGALNYCPSCQDHMLCRKLAVYTGALNIVLAARTWEKSVVLASGFFLRE